MCYCNWKRKATGCSGWKARRGHETCIFGFNRKINMVGGRGGGQGSDYTCMQGKFFSTPLLRWFFACHGALSRKVCNNKFCHDGSFSFIWNTHPEKPHRHAPTPPFNTQKRWAFRPKKGNKIGQTVAKLKTVCAPIFYQFSLALSGQHSQKIIF